MEKKKTKTQILSPVKKKKEKLGTFNADCYSLNARLQNILKESKFSRKGRLRE